MNDEELRDYLKRFCFGREHLICSRDLVRQKNLRESDLRKKVNRLRRKAVPIASSREGYFYASNAAELAPELEQRLFIRFPQPGVLHHRMRNAGVSQLQPCA